MDPNKPRIIHNVDGHHHKIIGGNIQKDPRTNIQGDTSTTFTGNTINTLNVIIVEGAGSRESVLQSLMSSLQRKEDFTDTSEKDETKKDNKWKS